MIVLVMSAHKFKFKFKFGVPMQELKSNLKATSNKDCNML